MHHELLEVSIEPVLLITGRLLVPVILLELRQECSQREANIESRLRPVCSARASIRLMMSGGSRTETTRPDGCGCCLLVATKAFLVSGKQGLQPTADVREQGRIGPESKGTTLPPLTVGRDQRGFAR